MLAGTADGLFAPVFFKKGSCYLLSARRSPGRSLALLALKKKRNSEVLKGRMREFAEDEKDWSAKLVEGLCCMGQ